MFPQNEVENIFADEERMVNVGRYGGKMRCFSGAGVLKAKSSQVKFKVLVGVRFGFHSFWVLSCHGPQDFVFAVVSLLSIKHCSALVSFGTNSYTRNEFLQLH